MKTWMFLLTFIVISCGGNDGRDGNDGDSPDPIPGKPGENGRPGEDSITKEIDCLTKWELDGNPPGRYYDILYVVLRTSSETSWAALKTTYHVGSESVLDTEQTALFPKISGKAQSSPIATTLWSSKLLSETEALITKQPGNIERIISCK